MVHRVAEQRSSVSILSGCVQTHPSAPATSAATEAVDFQPQ